MIDVWGSHFFEAQRFFDMLRNLPVLLLFSSLQCRINGLNTIFPVSTRQALIERSKLINPEQYSAAGWSNRAATVLTPVSLDGIYTADRPFYWNNIDVGCRSTIIELPGDETKKPDLWIHSPVNLDGPMIRSLENIGTVRTVITPNYEHTKFAGAWYQNYKATMIGCPGLAERLTDISWDNEVPVGYRPPGWKDGRSAESEAFDERNYWDMSLLQCIQINVEQNPFTGRPFFNEVVFFHVPSKTLLTTDLYWNYPSSGIPNEEFGRDDTWELAPKLPEVPFGSRAWKFGMDKIYSPFYSNLMVKDSAEYQKIADHIVNVWQPEIVVPAHGDILRGKDIILPILSEFFGLKQ